MRLQNRPLVFDGKDFSEYEFANILGDLENILKSGGKKKALRKAQAYLNSLTSLCPPDAEQDDLPKEEV